MLKKKSGLSDVQEIQYAVANLALGKVEFSNTAERSGLELAKQIGP